MWQEQKIIVLQEIIIAPPYTEASLMPGKRESSALPRVGKVLSAIREKLQLE